MPRPLVNEEPMTGAERQARYRAAHAAGAPVVRTRRPTDRRSRIQRWNDAIAAAVELQAEYAGWGIAKLTDAKTCAGNRRAIASHHAA